jgi:hypothetical protein
VTETPQVAFHETATFNRTGDHFKLPCPARSEGEVDWLGQFDDLPKAQIAMTAWLRATDRGDNDAAFILPLLAWGHAQAMTDA